MPCTGSDAYTLCVTLDKALTKKLLAGFGIPSPRGRLVTRESLRAGGLDELRLPGHREAELRGVVEGHHAGERRRRRRGARAPARRAPRDLPGRRPRRALRPGGRRPRRARGRRSRRLTPVELARRPDLRRAASTSSTTRSSTRTRASSRACSRRASARVTSSGSTSSRRAPSRRSACATPRRSTSASGSTARCTSSARAPLPSFEPDAALFAATRAAGYDYDATILAVVRAAAHAHRAPPAPRRDQAARQDARRTALRVGLAFNMKRIDSHDGDDREAEYDAPQTIEALSEGDREPRPHRRPARGDGRTSRAR